ncbi:nucleoside hydrolase [Prescottella subtropica]|uniref:nucleoside hydrolase n=1 Tax=Prescottella subtropica TaxID=2545757 RepID=UPI0010F55FD2|nr:nucleoside hydrolase [Prescottella subtropica]
MSAGTGRRVLIDTDTGVDDALAILTVLAAPDTEVVGVGTVFGNCDEGQAAANALLVLATAGRTDVPVCVGRPRPGPALSVPSPHGVDGLGDSGLPRPVGSRPSQETAVAQMLRWSRQHPGEVDLLCLGPLTNVAAALDRDPGLLTRFRSVTVMGGMGAAGRRDRVAAEQLSFLGKGDTNTAHDPAATARVAAAPGPVTWVGMDVTARLQILWADVESRAASSDIARFVRVISADYRVHCTRTYDADRPMVTSHDSVAAAVLLEPAVVRASAGLVCRVEHDRDGRASLWGHPPDAGDPRHRVVTDLDYAAVRAVVDRTLAPTSRVSRT